MPFGFLDTTRIDFPNIDLTYIEGLRTRAGVDFPELLQEIDARINALNANIDPFLASLITATPEISIDTTAPTAFTIGERGEYSLPRPQFADDSAHMLPIRGYDVALGFTEDGLESMTRARILNQIDSVLAGFRLLYRKTALGRLFSSAEWRVAPKSTATSPGFAGSGTGYNVFSRSYPDGTPLPGGYTHYYAANTSTGGALKAALLAAVTRLRMWHTAPFDLVANQTLIDLISAITGSGPADSFVQASTLLVQPAQGQTVAQVDPNDYVGVLFGDVRVRKPITDTASPNIAIYKSFGPVNEANPLAWRFDELKGRDAFLRFRDLYPLHQAVVKQDFGIGVNDRTAAVLVYATAGASSYTNPTDLPNA